ncbi:MAG: hypothetical protein FWC79_04200 [Oscillospiraceae bacterium]|nr:hypothetical protein [Oscillospiraceae bacterium]
MNINSILKKEGITVISELNTLEVDIIAKNVSSKLCLAFPEHNLNRSVLFESFSTLKMFIANMPDNADGAKYFSKNNSIYFSETIPFDNLADIAMHECIHFVQEKKDIKGNIISMGLYDMSSGLGINEATVQLMASEANMLPISEEKYFDISLSTISPDYYPLECSLVNQIAYFTGTYPLYHSALNGNDVFKKTFVTKVGEKTYNKILKNLDKLLLLESDLSYFISQLNNAEKPREIKLLGELAAAKKQAILALFFATQNIIMKKFFSAEFNCVKTLNDIREFKQKIYNFKNVIGTTDGYEFYNRLYREMMELLQRKHEYIENHGDISLFYPNNYNSSTALVVVENTVSAFSFMNIFFKKLGKLFKHKPVIQSINEVE